MKKKWDLLPKIWQYRKSKFFLRMKISMILLLVGVMHLSASTFSQTRVSLNMKDATVQEIFSKLEKYQTYYWSIQTNDGTEIGGTGLNGILKDELINLDGEIKKDHKKYL